MYKSTSFFNAPTGSASMNSVVHFTFFKDCATAEDEMYSMNFLWSVYPIENTYLKRVLLSENQGFYYKMVSYEADVPLKKRHLEPELGVPFTGSLLNTTLKWTIDVYTISEGSELHR